MNSERFCSALDGISDGLIDAAAGAYENRRKKKKTLIRVLWVACAGLVVAAVGLFWNAPAGAPDPTQPTISMENPTTAPTFSAEHSTTEPTDQPEKGSEGAKISFLSTKNGEETETPLEIGITMPIDYIVYVRNTRGLSDEKHKETIAQWHAFEEEIKSGGHGYTCTSFVGQEMIIGTYMKGFLRIRPDHSKIKHISVDTTNEGVGNYGYGHQDEEFHVNWFINPQILIEDRSLPLSSVHDSLEVTITYKDGTTEIIIIDISLNDEGQVFATLVEDSLSA